MALKRHAFAVALACLCCSIFAADAGALPVNRRSADEPSALEPLVEGDLNGFLLKRLVEMCLDAGDRCNLQQLEAEAQKIGFSSEHGRAFYRLVGFCGSSGEQRLGDCVALAAGLTRQLLLGEESCSHFRRLLDSVRRANTQAVADTVLLLTAQRRQQPTTTEVEAINIEGRRRRRRRNVVDRAWPAMSESATEIRDLGATGSEAGASSVRVQRPKRSVSPFMFGMYAQFSKDCGGGGQPCPAGSRGPHRIRIVDQ